MELERILDQTLNEQHQLIYQIEQTLKPDHRSKSMRDLQLSPSHSRQQDLTKVSELQRNNEQLYEQLRASNDKYLNLKVENNKCKDEIHLLKR